ncbi:MAG: DUF1461 domain-containing protein [Dehalococcoidales bacterium]|nr:DUF1461 domain-containing protein [Dehalococcoidales bacterium]
MRIISRFAQWLFILCLPVLAITGSIAGAVNSTWLYTAGFEKHHVPESLAANSLPLTSADLRDIVHGFIRYFNSGEEFIHLTVQIDGQTIELFNQEEIIHFKDVKGLFRLDYGVLLGTFLYCLLFTLVSLFWRKGNYNRLLARSAIIGSGIGLGILALIGIGILLDFDSLFYGFHLISFSNDFWSAEGNMLLLFPGGFWYDMVVYVALFAIALSLIPGIIGGIYIIKGRRNKRD